MIDITIHVEVVVGMVDGTLGTVDLPQLRK